MFRTNSARLALIVGTVALLCAVGAFQSFAQSSSAKPSDAAKPAYQVGTVVEVKAHQPAAKNVSGKQYDISIKVGNTIYVVLYTAPPGSTDPQYRTGVDGPVLVQGKTLKFNDILGNSHELPILRKQAAPPDSK